MTEEKTYIEGTKEELINLFEQNYVYNVPDSNLTFKSQIESIDQYSDNGFGAVAYTEKINKTITIKFQWVRIDKI